MPPARTSRHASAENTTGAGGGGEPPAAVHVRDVTFAYGADVAVEDVTLTVPQGEFLGLIGPNGSGKTTLLHLVLGLETPDSGSIELFGTPVEEFDDGARVGYVAQRSTDRGGAMPATVREVVTMGRYARAGRSRLSARDHAIVDATLETVGIAALEDRRLDRLSGGQRQRTFIARALASEPDLLALDEPTVGVDADSRDQFYGLLQELNAGGITIILIEHDIDILTTHVDSIACLNRRLFHHGDTVSFFESDALAAAYGRSHGVIGHEHP